MKQESLRKLAWKALLWLVLAAVAITLYHRAATIPEPMEPDELARSARKLASDALEASALARALATGQLTLHFAIEHHEQVAQDVGDVRQALDRSPPPGREERAQGLREAAQRLGELLLEVPLHTADSAAMSRISADAEAIAAQIGPGNGT